MSPLDVNGEKRPAYVPNGTFGPDAGGPPNPNGANGAALLPPPFGAVNPPYTGEGEPGCNFRYSRTCCAKFAFGPYHFGPTLGAGGFGGAGVPGAGAGTFSFASAAVNPAMAFDMS